MREIIEFRDRRPILSRPVLLLAADVDGRSANWTREVSPYVCVHPDEKWTGYLGCCSVFGLAASWARFAINSSYLGVPRRGGASSGRPPIQCGMSATCPPAQDVSVTHVRHRNANLSVVEKSILLRCRGIVAERHAMARILA